MLFVSRPHPLRLAVIPFLLHVAACSAFGETPASPIYGPLINPANGNSYYLLDHSTWTAANLGAWALNGNLVTIRNQTENDWVFNNLAQHVGSGTGIWLGLTDVAGGSFNWKWTSGEAVTYYNWDAGEPNFSGVEHYGQMFNLPGREGKWNNTLNDNYGHEPVFGVVEVPVVQHPAAPISGPIINPANGHRYYLLNHSTSTDAIAGAALLGGHLATVRNQAENDWIFNTFAAPLGQESFLWLGLVDHGVGSPDFEWASGETVTFTNWDSGEPNTLGFERYTEMFNLPGKEGKWNNAYYNNYEHEFVYGVVEIVPEPGTFGLASLSFTIVVLKKRGKSRSRLGSNRHF